MQDCYSVYTAVKSTLHFKYSSWEVNRIACLNVALNSGMHSLFQLKLIIMYLMHTIAILSCQTYITQATKLWKVWINMHKIMSYIDLNVIQNISHISLYKRN